MSYRVDDKGNAHINGRPATTFKLFEYSAEHEGFVFVGQYHASGQDATDEQCIDAALAVLAGADE